MKWTLAPWLWKDDEAPARHRWDAPMANCVARFDFRRREHRIQIGGAGQGFGLFVHDDPTFTDGIDLGEDPTDAIRNRERDAIESALGLRVASTRLGDAYAELLLLHADPAGLAHHKPWTGRIGRALNIHISGFPVRSERITQSHPAWTAMREVFRADYRAERALVRTQEDLDHLRRWTGYEVLANGLNGPEDLLPPEHVADGMLDPSTTIGDTFTDTGSTSLDAHTATGSGGGWSWTEVSTGFAIDSGGTLVSVDSTGGSHKTARAESALSSADHYAELSVVSLGTGSNQVALGPSCRFAAAADTHYSGYIYQNNDNAYIIRFEAGSQTTVNNAAASVSLPATWRLTVAPNSQVLARNGTTATSGSDTAISGGTRCGINGWDNASAVPTGDDFVAADSPSSGAVAGAAVGTGVASAAITVRAPLVGAATGTGVAAGALSVDAHLVGAAVGTGVASASLTVKAWLAGAATGTGVAAGVLSVTEPTTAALVGAAVGTGSALAALTVKAFLAGAATGTGVASGVLEVQGQGQMTGAAVGTGSCSATLLLNVPSDDDINPGATNRTDCDGATIRQAYLQMRHNFDSAKQGDLHDPLRVAPNRNGNIFPRDGMAPNLGHILVLDIECGGRAGELHALGDFFVDVAEVESNDYDESVAAGTDCDGATVIAPTITMRHGFDSARQADLVVSGTSVQRRFDAVHAFGSGSGFGSVVVIDFELSGRAGEVHAFGGFDLDVAEEEDDSRVAAT